MRYILGPGSPPHHILKFRVLLAAQSSLIIILDLLGHSGLTQSQGYQACWPGPGHQPSGPRGFTTFLNKSIFQFFIVEPSRKKKSMANEGNSFLHLSSSQSEVKKTTGKSLISFLLVLIMTVTIFNIVSVHIFTNLDVVHPSKQRPQEQTYVPHNKHIKISRPKFRNISTELQGFPLTCCIITANRENVSYIDEVLQSIEQEMLPGMKTRVLIIEVSLSFREDIQKAQIRFPRFAFHTLVNKTDEKCPFPDPEAQFGRRGNVACAVRQQSYDFSAAILQCAAFARGLGWLLLIEDDTPLCRGGLAEILFVLHNAQHHLATAGPSRRTFRLAIFSRTFSGTALPAALAPALADRLAAQARRQPVDHAVREDWAAGAVAEYRGNLFSHRGEVSAFRERNAAAYRRAHDARRFAAAKRDCALADAPAGAFLATVRVFFK